MIKTWSHSRLQDFEKCKYHAYLKYVERVPEPERPLPAGKTEHANDRGSRVHDSAEQYVRGTLLAPPVEFGHFETELNKLRDLFNKGAVSLEEEWAHDRDWNVTDWGAENQWLRLKLDAFVHLADDTAMVIDYKTGKKSGNEIKHAEQGQLYQLAGFLRYPKLQTIDVEFWYVDQDDLTHMRYTREQGMRFLKNFDMRAKRMTECVDFPPNPNIYNCRWCPYGPKKSGHCRVGV
jgi:RecB family exonuclease